MLYTSPHKSKSGGVCPAQNANVKAKGDGFILAFVCGPQASLASNAFLSAEGSLNSKAFKEEIMNAVGSMLGSHST